MPNEVNIYTPRYLAEVVRLAPPVFTFFRDTFFTNVRTFPTKAIDFDLVKGDRRMAAFVHPRKGGKVLASAGYETLSYKPPLINPYDVTTADQLMNRLPGEEMYSGMTPAQRAAQQQIADYARLNDGVTRREEWMCVQAIMTGQIPIVGDGVNEVIDFGFTNKKKLTGTAVWGGKEAAIADNLRQWKHDVAVNGFANVDMCVMGWKALEALSLIYPKTSIKEWFEYGGQPGYWRLNVDITDEPAVYYTPKEIEKRINYARRCSAHLEGVTYEINPPDNVTAYVAATPCSMAASYTVRLPGIIQPRAVNAAAYAAGAVGASWVQATVALPDIIRPKTMSAQAYAAGKPVGTYETVTIKIGGTSL